MPHHPASGDTAVFRGVSINITSNYFDVEIKKSKYTFVVRFIIVSNCVCVREKDCGSACSVSVWGTHVCLCA